MSGPEKYKIALDTPFETSLYVINGVEPGPVVAVIGGTHGNEPAGCRAAHVIKHFTIARGLLLVIPQANRPAVKARRREAKEIGDLNRSFPRKASEEPRNILSEAIWKIYKEYNVEWSIDLHEGWGVRCKNPLSVGQSLIYFPHPRSHEVGKKIVKHLNKKVSRPGRRFSLIDDTKRGTITRSTGTFLRVHSYTFETYRRQPFKTRINQHVTAVRALLKTLGMDPKKPT